MSDRRFCFLYLRISQKMCNFAPFLRRIAYLYWKNRLFIFSRQGTILAIGKPITDNENRYNLAYGTLAEGECFGGDQ